MRRRDGRRIPGLLLLLAAAASLPAPGQNDFAGEWSARYHEDFPERIPGPEIGDYLGIPLNDAARLRADSWNASLLTLPEWQCRPHPADYGTRGPADLRVWKDVDPRTQEVIAYHTHVQWQSQDRTIWMDGRAHPPADAPHSWQGFSTGKWEGNVLTVTTTHLKESYIRRNGVPRSDRGVLTEHWIRYGEVLTLVSIIADPLYLTEPFIRTTNWELNPGQNIEPYPCEVAEEVERPEGQVPHHLPGQNPFLSEFAERAEIPVAATRGGAETARPEYVERMASAAPATAPDTPTEASRPAAGDEILVQRVRGDVYMLSGAGGNVTVQLGLDGILLVDSGRAAAADKLLAEARKLSDKPIRYLVNTHIHPDHTGGNERTRKEGKTVAGGDVSNLTADSTEGAAIVAHAQVLNRMSAQEGSQAPPFEAWPTDIYIGKRKDMFVNDEPVQLLHPPAAHTDGDTIVFFRRSDVISTGDIFSTTAYPFVDLDRGGSIEGVIDALNQILDLTVPARNEEGGTYIIPGHGRISDEADVAYYRDMVTIIRDRILDMKTKGMTVEQVKAARPTRDYDPRYGANSGFYTTDMFVETVYRSLDQKQ